MRSFILCLLIVAMFCMTVSARDVQQGDTIYIGEQNLNILPALPEGTIGICLWNTTGNDWEPGYCIGTSGGSNNSLNNNLVDWKHGGVIPGDWYALPASHYRNIDIEENDSISTLVKVFTVLPASMTPSIPASTPISTPIKTTQNTRPQKITVRTAVPTVIPVMVITVSPTLQPTETVNYSATIAILQEQIANQSTRIDEQDTWIDTILKFLGLK